MNMVRPSRYNFAFLGNGGCVAIFNALSGAVLRVTGDDAKLLADTLVNPAVMIPGDELAPGLAHQLHRGGFTIDVESDELEMIRERYWRARRETPVVLTVTTTMDCNLGCYYCYEERSSRSLTSADVSDIVRLAASLIAESNRRALHVDWYGGEPLLNLEFLETASKALQDHCKLGGVRYAASIISNGSRWPQDVEAFVARNHIRQVQISFDGMQANHDRRRRYRKGYGAKVESSFAQAVELVDRLVKCVRVDLRFNTDRANSDDLVPFTHFARDRGWFSALYPAVFQPARLAAYSTTSAFMRTHELSLDQFDELRAVVRAELGAVARIEESEVPDGVPRPKSSVCAALASNSVVVGAEGLTYRCGLQVGETRRAVGALESRANVANRALDTGWWSAFDPTTLPTCSKCSFLPVCWGGCPKKHLEGDQHAIQEQGRYWRTNLPRLVAMASGIGDLIQEVIPESLQFR